MCSPRGIQHSSPLWIHCQNRDQHNWDQVDHMWMYHCFWCHNSGSLLASQVWLPNCFAWAGIGVQSRKTCCWQLLSALLYSLKGDHLLWGIVKNYSCLRHTQLMHIFWKLFILRFSLAGCQINAWFYLKILNYSLFLFDTLVWAHEGYSLVKVFFS